MPWNLAYTSRLCALWFRALPLAPKHLFVYFHSHLRSEQQALEPHISHQRIRWVFQASYRKCSTYMKISIFMISPQTRALTACKRTNGTRVLWIALKVPWIAADHSSRRCLYTHIHWSQFRSLVPARVPCEECNKRRKRDPTLKRFFSSLSDFSFLSRSLVRELLNRS